MVIAPDDEALARYVLPDTVSAVADAFVNDADVADKVPATRDEILVVAKVDVPLTVNAPEKFPVVAVRAPSEETSA